MELFDIAHQFQAGHRIRVEVTSSAAPYYNPNQNTGNPVATDTVWKVARQTIYHDRARPSAITLPIMAKNPVPRGGRLGFNRSARLEAARARGSSRPELGGRRSRVEAGRR